jgi:hypothetical protein
VEVLKNGVVATRVGCAVNFSLPEFPTYMYINKLNALFTIRQLINETFALFYLSFVITIY